MTSSAISNAVEVQVSITICRPRQLVWNVLADVGRQPEWMRDALSIEILTDGPMGVGTRMEVPTQIGFLRTTDTMEVTEFDPPARWTVVHRGLVRGEGTFTLREHDQAPSDATEVEWRERLAAPFGPVGRGAMTLFRPLLRRQFQQDLDRLRDLCEA